MSTCTYQEWNSFIKKCPEVHILQSADWGELKSQFGWKTIRLISGSIGAQILFQPLPFGYHIGYIPKGPISLNGQIDDPSWESFQNELDILCREQKAVFIKIEPDAWDEELFKKIGYFGYRKSNNSIQPPRTILVDLSESEEQILARMKSKTRYNIRLSEKKEVSIRQLDNIDPFYKLLENTADRSEFGIHTREYYQAVFDLFYPSGECKLFMAEYQEQPLASIMVFVHGKRCWYFYGASSDEHRDRMPTYLVQWEAMRLAKEQGCLTYDLWGVPDEDQDTLESNFMERNEGLWGVYRFKRGFGGELKRASSSLEKEYNPILYLIYLLYSYLKKISVLKIGNS